MSNVDTLNNAVRLATRGKEARELSQVGEELSCAGPLRPGGRRRTRDDKA